VSSPRLSFAAGVGLGLITPLVVILSFARVLTVIYNGLDGDGTYGIAVVGTRELAAALDRYRGQYHHIPDEREGLTKLAPEFLPSVDTDPWNHPYLYDRTGPDWADVLSYGADGRPGGSGDGSDISARFGRLGPHPPSVLRTLVTVLLVGLPLAAALRGAAWSDGVLAGMSVFWGGMVLVMFGGSLQSLVAPLSGIIGVTCFAGAIALARELPFARRVTFLAVVVAYAIAYYLLSR
jgi:general secretion pathway protein G